MTATKYLGFVSKIEQEETSCNREEVSKIVVTTGSVKDEFNGVTNDPQPAVTDSDAIDLTFSASIMDLSAAATNYVALGDWETVNTDLFSECSYKSASLASYEFTDPVLSFLDSIDEDLDVIDYELETGQYPVEITQDWLTDPDTCAMNMTYQVFELINGV